MAAAPLKPLEPSSEAGSGMPAAPAPAAPVAGKMATSAARLTPGASATTTHHGGAMDRDFIARNQIVERYLSGKLPIKGATDFERFCRDNPQLLDELGLPERVNAGLRLLEASGKPEPWQEARKKLWERPALAIGLAAATLALGITLGVVASGRAEKNRQI